MIVGLFLHGLCIVGFICLMVSVILNSITYCVNHLSFHIILTGNAWWKSWCTNFVWNNANKSITSAFTSMVVPLLLMLYLSPHFLFKYLQLIFHLITVDVMTVKCQDPSGIYDSRSIKFTLVMLTGEKGETKSTIC